VVLADTATIRRVTATYLGVQLTGVSLIIANLAKRQLIESDRGLIKSVTNVASKKSFLRLSRD
jgi:hypothetical protein